MTVVEYEGHLLCSRILMMCCCVLLNGLMLCCQDAKASPLGGAWCGMVWSLAISWARWIGFLGERLLLLVYCPLSRHPPWLYGFGCEEKQLT